MIQSRLTVMRDTLSDANGDWAIKGFIDVWRAVYPMTPDTKVLSKVLEVLLIPVFLEAIVDTPLKVEFAAHQNHYPDLTVLDQETNTMVAIDLKSTYYVSSKRVNGFTLGAFTGYFRDRQSRKNVVYPYSKYSAHLVLGVVYEKKPGASEGEKFKLEDLSNIPSVAGNFRFLVQPKWAIASTRPGSGNTKNIGSVVDVETLVSGAGPFTVFEDPEAAFDDYWMNYLTADMARAAETKVPYRNLDEYLAWKNPPRLRS
jgi:hypothetical protein